MVIFGVVTQHARVKTRQTQRLAVVFGAFRSNPSFKPTETIWAFTVNPKTTSPVHVKGNYYQHKLSS